MTFDPVKFRDEIDRLATKQVISSEPEWGWRIFKLRTSKNKVRTICEPNQKLKEFQREIASVLVQLPTSDACFSKPGKSTVDNALVHLGSDVLYKTDIADFYPSINKSKVGCALSNIAEDLEGADWLSYGDVGLNYLLQCCWNLSLEGVPTGAPTSPVLSNISMYQADKQLNQLATEHGYKYTRYFDDLTFSKKGSSEMNLSLADEIKDILSGWGFLIKESKSKWLAPNTHESYEVTGISLGNGQHTTINNKLKKHIRLLLDKRALGTLAPEDQSVLNGYLAYVNMVDKEYREKLNTYYEERVNLYVNKHS